MIREKKTEFNWPAGHYLVFLMGCALQDTLGKEKWKRKPEAVTWEQVYALSKHCGVEGISYFGVKKLEEQEGKKADLPADPLMKAWKQEADQICYRTLCFDEERNAILKEMEAQGLSYLPLKGIRLAEHYPHPGMRLMADNDILYGFIEPGLDGGYQIAGADESSRDRSVLSAQKVMREIMNQKGYKTENLKGNHDVYLKKPFYNFEMHRMLMGEGQPNYEYYKNPWKRAIQDTANPYAYFFSDEDEYLYLLAHAFKHFYHGGCGIRFLADLYVFQKSKGDSLDRRYLTQELRKMGMEDFEAKMSQLSIAALEGKLLNRKEAELLRELLGCGTYGTIRTHVEKKLERLSDSDNSFKHAKWRYIWKRIVPEKEFCKNYFPFFYRHRYLMPVLFLYRVGKGVIQHPKKLWAECKILMETGRKEK